MFKDAIDTASESADIEIAEELLRFFVTVHDKACFAATLFTCYELIRPDVVLELAWRYGYNDYAMPFLVQYLRHVHDKLHIFETRTAPPKEEVNPANDPAALGMMGNMMLGNETLMITNGSSFGGAPYGPPGGFGGMASIPDPYNQQPAGMYGVPGYGMPPIAPIGFPGGGMPSAGGFGGQW